MVKQTPDVTRSFLVLGFPNFKHFPDLTHNNLQCETKITLVWCLYELKDCQHNVQTYECISQKFHYMFWPFGHHQVHHWCINNGLITESLGTLVRGSPCKNSLEQYSRKYNAPEWQPYRIYKCHSCASCLPDGILQRQQINMAITIYITPQTCKVKYIKLCFKIIIQYTLWLHNLTLSLVISGTNLYFLSISGHQHSMPSRQSQQTCPYSLF
jgi:hypothetical protein